MKDFIDKCSAQFLIGSAGRAVERLNTNPNEENFEIAVNITTRLSVYFLSQAGAKYAGDIEGPRRNHE